MNRIRVEVSCESCLLSYPARDMAIAEFTDGARETVCPDCIAATEAEGVNVIVSVEPYCTPVLPGQPSLLAGGEA